MGAIAAIGFISFYFSMQLLFSYQNYLVCKGSYSFPYLLKRVLDELSYSRITAARIFSPTLGSHHVTIETPNLKCFKSNPN